jgi:hypothetical protein
MNATPTTVSSRNDLAMYLADARPDLTALGERYVDAVCDQIQASDHPAWGDDWAAWFAEELDALIDDVRSIVNAVLDAGVRNRAVEIDAKLYAESDGGTTLVVEYPLGIDDYDLDTEIDCAVRAQHPNIIPAWEALCDAGHAPVPDETALVRPGRAEWRIA